MHTLAPALAELIGREWDKGTEHFQPTTFQVSNLNAGTGAPNVIPGELKARFNLRYSPVQTLETLKGRVGGRSCAVTGSATHWSGTCRASPSTPRRGALSRCRGRMPSPRSPARSRSFRPAGAPPTAASSPPLGAQVVELGVVSA